MEGWRGESSSHSHAQSIVGGAAAGWRWSAHCSAAAAARGNSSSRSSSSHGGGGGGGCCLRFATPVYVRTSTALRKRWPNARSAPHCSVALPPPPHAQYHTPPPSLGEDFPLWRACCFVFIRQLFAALDERTPLRSALLSTRTYLCRAFFRFLSSRHRRFPVESPTPTASRLRRGPTYFRQRRYTVRRRRRCRSDLPTDDTAAAVVVRAGNNRLSYKIISSSWTTIRSSPSGAPRVPSK